MDGAAIAFPRSDDGRVVAGVAAGFARRHGVDPLVVRGVLVVLTFAAGLGLVIYALGAALSQPAPPAEVEPAPVQPRRSAAVALVGAGLLLVVRSTGLWIGDAAMAVVVVLVAGVVVLGTTGGSDVGSRLAALAEGRHARLRVLLGASLLALGLVMVGTAHRVSGTVRVGVIAAALSIVGAALLVGPWIARLARAATEERRQRIRSEEREAMAAHLHDSVLQTLALIQRNADDPRRTASLARQQEHELREWLFGGDVLTADTLAAALSAMGRELEARYDVRVEVVAVGDAPLDDALQAVVAAAREAGANAATHSGDPSVSVYAEVGHDAVEVFVRDRGRGFDPAAAAGDRRGIAQSIIGRMERVGGSAEVVSSQGSGTEVRLRMPRTQSEDEKVTR